MKNKTEAIEFLSKKAGISKEDIEDSEPIFFHQGEMIDNLSEFSAQQNKELEKDRDEYRERYTCNQHTVVNLQSELSQQKELIEAKQKEVDNYKIAIEGSALIRQKNFELEQEIEGLKARNKERTIERDKAYGVIEPLKSSLESQSKEIANWTNRYHEKCEEAAKAGGKLSIATKTIESQSLRIKELEEGIQKIHDEFIYNEGHPQDKIEEVIDICISLLSTPTKESEEGKEGE